MTNLPSDEFTFAACDAIFCAFTFRHAVAGVRREEAARCTALPSPPSSCRRVYTRAPDAETGGEKRRIPVYRCHSVSIYGKPIEACKELRNLFRTSEFKHSRLYTSNRPVEESYRNIADDSDAVINRVIGRLDIASNLPSPIRSPFSGEYSRYNAVRLSIDDCRIIDRRSQPARVSRDSRAVNVQSRTAAGAYMHAA